MIGVFGSLRDLLNSCATDVFNCCGESNAADRYVHKMHRISSRLQRITARLEHVLKAMQDDLAGDTTVRHNECCRRKKFILERFYRLDESQKQQWIEFQKQLLSVSREVSTNTEYDTSAIVALKDANSAIGATFEYLSETQDRQRKIRALSIHLAQLAETAVSDARIRTRFIKILRSTRNEQLFASWKEQLKREEKEDVPHKAFTEFLREAETLSKEIVSGIVSPATSGEARYRRQQIHFVKAKLGLMSSHIKRVHNDISKWEKRQTRHAASHQEDLEKLAEQMCKRLKRIEGFFERCSSIFEEVHAKLSSTYEEYESIQQKFSGGEAAT